MKKLDINKLGYDLRVKRAENDISQTKLAILLGATQPTIASIENKKRDNFNFKTILNVVTYLGKTLNDYVI